MPPAYPWRLCLPWHGMVPPWARMLSTQGPEELIPDQQPVTVTGLLKRPWGHGGPVPLTTEEGAVRTAEEVKVTHRLLYTGPSRAASHMSLFSPTIKQPFLHWLVCHLNTFILSLCIVIRTIRHYRPCEVDSALPCLALPSAHWLQYRPSRDTVW